MRIKCTVSYDGTNFCGYQKQPGLRTVQDELEKAVSCLNKKPTGIISASRTDAHVHAKGQVFCFDSDYDIPPRGWKNGFNSLLPKDIYVSNVEIVDDDFHARFDVKWKEYHFLINMGEYDPLMGNYMTFHHNLDVEKMQNAAKKLIGTHDFKAFSTDYHKENTVRTIFEARLDRMDDILIFKIKGDGFLKYMVRRIVGTLVEIGNHRIEGSIIDEALENPQTIEVGKTELANGLYLIKVEY